MTKQPEPRSALGLASAQRWQRPCRMKLIADLSRLKPASDEGRAGAGGAAFALGDLWLSAICWKRRPCSEAC